MTPTLRGFFVTGTDTGIGKTTLAAWLLCALRRQGVQAIPMKPVQTGHSEGLPPDPAFCLQAAGLQVDQATWAHICPYQYPLPASPHLAAARAGARIEMEAMLHSARWLATRHEALIIEGAGGVMVPLNDREMMLHLITRLNLPVVVAARPSLGTLNHTLLTLSALRAAGARVAGVVFVRTTDEEPSLIEQDNRVTIERLGHAPVWGSIPYMPQMGTDTVTGQDLLLAAEAGGCSTQIPLLND